MSKSPSSMLRVTAALLILLLARLPAYAQTAADEAIDKITQLNKDAIAAYQAKKYDDARKTLKQALEVASGAGLDKHPIAARTHVHLGIVILVGFNQRDLGIKQFKKAIEIQPEINLTKALVTPELTAAFAEAKTPSGGRTPAPVAAVAPPGAPAPAPAAAPPPLASPASVAAPAHAAPPAPSPPSPTAPPSVSTAPAANEPDASGGGLTHEAVTEGRQGSAISITVGVSDALEFDKIVLAYRPDGAVEFLGREMKQVSQGHYGAEIPNPATSGNVVAYYIEAQNADGGLIAARGSVDNPMVIHLTGVGASRHDKDEDNDEEDVPDARIYVGLMAGTGVGWAAGDGDTNADTMINPAGLALAGAAQVSPEVGYWVSSSLLLSMQVRYQLITGTTDVYENGHQYHTADYALAVFARATWKYLQGPFHPFFALAAGGGRIRHVVSFRNQGLVRCGQAQNQACVDTIGAGPVLLGPGAGLMYDLGERTALVVQLNSTLGFPTFTVNLDANVGVAVGF